MVVPLSEHPMNERDTAPTSKAAGTAASEEVTATTPSVLNPGLALTVRMLSGSKSCPCPPAAPGKKLPAHVIELLGKPSITVVRWRFGSSVPEPAANAVSTPGAGNSQQAFELMLVSATLVTCTCGLLVVRIT